MLLDLGGGVLGRTLSLSIALTPATGPAHVAAGSFSVNGA
jgi:hypothetical protein